MNESTIAIMMIALDSWPNAELAALNLCLSWQTKVPDTNIEAEVAKFIREIPQNIQTLLRSAMMSAFARVVECGFTDPDGSGRISSCCEELCEALSRVINTKVANGTWV